ncbi:hypothetical protein Bbelb_284180 [Branchiostoma belcheri]|nr:hypothetical protein Bbelb_284180 [Branchiostoma belcheri]
MASNIPFCYFVFATEEMTLLHGPTICQQHRNEPGNRQEEGNFIARLSESSEKKERKATAVTQKRTAVSSALSLRHRERLGPPTRPQLPRFGGVRFLRSQRKRRPSVIQEVSGYRETAGDRAVARLEANRQTAHPGSDLKARAPTTQAGPAALPPGVHPAPSTPLRPDCDHNRHQHHAIPQTDRGQFVLPG